MVLCAMMIGAIRAELLAEHLLRPSLMLVVEITLRVPVCEGPPKSSLFGRIVRWDYPDTIWWKADEPQGRVGLGAE